MKVHCMGPGCNNKVNPGDLRCEECLVTGNGLRPPAVIEKQEGMAARYPQYYKAIPPGITDADTYVINKMFPIRAEDDPTGTVLHARKKLLVPGCRTGGKTFYQDIKEARDTLNRFLDLMKPE